MLTRMKRSLLIHAGFGLVPGGALILIAALTWIPGVVPPDWSPGVPLAALLLAFPLFVAAVARLLLARVSKATLWEAFRCLPGMAQLGIGGGLVAGLGTLFSVSAGPYGHLQAPEEDGVGRYTAFDTSVRETVEVSREVYLAVVGADLRMSLGMVATMLVAAGAAVLLAGEVRRWDQARGPGPDRVPRSE
ncbi:hypothetical protein KQH42_16075 [Streptomyces sp. CHA1]|nr:hypothetical protein [Streptomyces sp. G11C]MCO6701902.1 hypothetical protein [Streptomyces sp. CHB9.2]MCO6708254.1 hypothetical protein [Streptomyces sp. CHA3]MCO6714267.1 hypothetical protein [Streptomyces sp. CHB19.2]MCO6720415.1 hypothetical protein [Streptomyces sp. Vc714c-19]MCO6725932.1 hypothetical protein [Streptomyces sp. CHA16]MCO6731826.1 hypothetical protein [Streptomyces sp. EL9]MCO6737806.1 hypothetical protein [Streptomyces sp. CHA15]MCO6743787.1 hypothetical protein [Str